MIYFGGKRFDTNDQAKERRREYHGCKIARTSPSVTHLLFADDAFLFFRATPQECQVVKLVLKTYKKASGHEVNFSKSSIIFSSSVFVDMRLDIKKPVGSN